METKQQSHLPSSGFLPIRAPLTLSDEDDDGFYYECPKIAIHSDSNNTSFSSFTNRSNPTRFESGSEGFVSVGEDVELALERPSVATPREETIKVDESKPKDEFFRPFVRYPHEETLEKIENAAKNQFFRPFVAHPDEVTLEKVENVAKDDFVRPFASYPDENASQNNVAGSSSVEELFRPFIVGSEKEIVEENGDGVKDNFCGSSIEDKDGNKLACRLEKDSGSDGDDYASAADAAVLSGQSPNLNTMPIARLSMDSDEDEGIPFEAEDDDCVVTVRIPGFAMVQKMDAASEIKVVGQEERECNESLLGQHSAVVNHTSTFVGDGNLALGGGEKVLVEMDSMSNSVYAKVSQDDDQGSMKNSPEECCEVEEESSHDDIEEIRSEDMLESVSTKVTDTDNCVGQACDVGKDLIPKRAQIDFFKSNTALRKVDKQDVNYVLEETMFPATNEHGIYDTDAALDKDPNLGTAEYASDLPEANRFPKMDEESYSSSNALNTDSSSDPQSKAEEGDEFDYNLGKAKVDEESLPCNKETETSIIDVSETDKQLLEFKRIVGTSELVDRKFELPSSELEVTRLNEDTYREGKEIVDSNSCTSTVTSQENFEAFSFEQHAGSDIPFISSEPALRSNSITLLSLEDNGHLDCGNNFDGKEKEKLDKIQLLRVKLLRLIQRLGYSHEDSICKQVLYHLATAVEGYNTQACNLESEKKVAMQLEADGGMIDFPLNILVLGKTGVGKSRTINSIFGESKTSVNAFEPATSTVKEIVGVIDGIKIRFLDTPGLRISSMDQAVNRKILASIKKFAKRYPPDVVLYVDRLDSQTKDSNDLLLLHSITSSLGSSIWQNVIITLTHGAAALPNGPTGSPLDYEAFVTQRYYLIQRCITLASCDLRLMNPSCMFPSSLIENCPDGKNELKPGLFPDVQIWRSQLLLLCYSWKILVEATSISGTEDLFDLWKLFGSCTLRSLPLPFLLQSCAHPKVVLSDQSDIESTIEWEEVSDSDQEYMYDQLPLFKPLMRSDIAKISKDQRKESKRLKWMKLEKNGSCVMEDARAVDEAAADTAFPQPDINRPLSFDGDDLAYRYQCMDTVSGILMRPVLYIDTTNISKSFPFIDHGVVAGWKVGDQIKLGKCAVLSSSAVGVSSRSDTSDGANFKAHIMEKDFLMGQDQCTAGFSLARNGGEINFAANLKSLVSIGRSPKLAFDVSLKNKHNGKITVRASSSEHLHAALLSILPLAFSVFRTLLPNFDAL